MRDGIAVTTMNDIQYIDTIQALDRMCEHLRDREWLAVDTEFIRIRTYFPRLALVQIADAEQIYCVDPVALSDLSPLFEMLEMPSITKVFHSGGQDLEIFFQERGCLPEPIFDTQIAAALLGMGEQIGYGALVEKMLDVALAKSQTRTDWMKRPLKTAQLNYAADDVRYLRQLYPLLQAELERLGRTDWLQEDVVRLHHPAAYQIDLESCWQRVKGAGKLKRDRLNVLKHLASWREEQAMKNDLPRRWLLPDEVLIGLAAMQPQDRQQLVESQLMDHRDVSRYGNELVAVIARAQTEPEDIYPKGNHSKKPTEQEDATVDRLHSLVTDRAEALAIAPGQIASRSDIMKLIRGERKLPLLEGWRRAVAGEALLAALPQ